MLDPKQIDMLLSFLAGMGALFGGYKGYKFVKPDMKDGCPIIGSHKTPLTKEEHDELCTLKLEPIKKGVDEIKHTTHLNHIEMDKKFNKVMDEIRDIPRKVHNGGKR